MAGRGGIHGARVGDEFVDLALDGVGHPPLHADRGTLVLDNGDCRYAWDVHCGKKDLLLEELPDDGVRGIDDLRVVRRAGHARAQVDGHAT